MSSFVFESNNSVYSDTEKDCWERIWNYNRKHLPQDHMPSEIYNIHCKNKDGELSAAIFTESYLNFMFVKLLFVDEESRKHGLGKKLLSEIEEHARKRACTHCYLDTFSFQAPAFYKRLGYKEFGVLEEFPPGHKRHFFVKELLPNDFQQ